jgi:hypothetical protein
MGKNDIGHAGEILIEQRPEDARVQPLHKRGETGDVGKKCRNLAALPAEIDAIHPRHIDWPFAFSAARASTPSRANRKLTARSWICWRN